MSEDRRGFGRRERADSGWRGYLIQRGVMEFGQLVDMRYWIPDGVITTRGVFESQTKSAYVTILTEATTTTNYAHTQNHKNLIIYIRPS